MIEPNLWKITETLQALLERIENLEEQNEQQHKSLEAFANYSIANNQIIGALTKEIEFLKNKKTPI